MTKILREFEKRFLERSKFFGPQQPDTAGRKPIAIVTGGSEGIGLALARVCAELGLNVLIIARDSAKLQSAAQKVEKDSIAEVESLSVDFADADSADQVVTFLRENGYFPHLLINNVGIGLGGPFHGQSREDIERLVAVNVTSWTALTRALLPDMLKRQKGGIINISSIAGMLPGPYQAAYYASKAYMNSLSEALSQELAFTGVRVSAVAPGPVATDFHAKMGAERSVYLFIQNVLSPERVARSSVVWFALRRRMIVPGLLNSINAIFIKIIPHAILVPLMSVLLKRRGDWGTKDESA